MKNWHIVKDSILPGNILKQLNECWPNSSWPGWIRYRETHHSKQASDLTSLLPRLAGEILYYLAKLPWNEWTGRDDLIPDLGLWGAGLHEMMNGDIIGWHQDADYHPRLGLSRVLSVCLYVHQEWEYWWGGNLDLGVPPTVQPIPNRLVAFSRDIHHQVTRVNRPDGKSRRSLVLFLYGPPNSMRYPRARFDSVKDSI